MTQQHLKTDCSRGVGLGKNEGLVPKVDIVWMESSINMLPKLQKNGTFTEIFTIKLLLPSQSPQTDHTKRKYFIFIIIFVFSNMFVPVLLFSYVNEGLIMPKMFFFFFFISPCVQSQRHTSRITENSAGETRDCYFTRSSVKRKASH